MRLNITAKILNRMPKKESKSHKEKELKYENMMKNKIVCEKCGKNETLYNVKDHYYCKECKNKKRRTKKNV